ncbi:MAG: hypothetical protein DMG59_04880 [Acidobacteria bacterium]|nr:MAG: hypothetical protein DMG59_04880 [Acidobacteriota bacterium]
MDGIQQGYPGVTGAYAPQLASQGFLGGLLGNPLGGVIGSGIGGLLGNTGIGRQIPTVGGIGGSTLPLTDPVTNAYLMQAQLAQQAQLGPQALLGNLTGSIGQPFGAIGGLLGSPISGGIGQLGRMLPFGVVDPVTSIYIQQAQLAHLAQLAQLTQLAHLTQLAQQAQLAQQLVQPGLLGSLVNPIGQPFGGLLGGPLGGGIGHIGRLPFQSQIGMGTPWY